MGVSTSGVGRGRCLEAITVIPAGTLASTLIAVRAASLGLTRTTRTEGAIRLTVEDAGSYWSSNTLRACFHHHGEHCEVERALRDSKATGCRTTCRGVPAEDELVSLDRVHGWGRVAGHQPGQPDRARVAAVRPARPFRPQSAGYRRCRRRIRIPCRLAPPARRSNTPGFIAASRRRQTRPATRQFRALILERALIRRVRALTGAQAIIRDEAVVVSGQKEPLWRFFPGGELNYDRTNWWAPNLGAARIDRCSRLWRRRGSVRRAFPTASGGRRLPAATARLLARSNDNLAPAVSNSSLRIRGACTSGLTSSHARPLS